jgi:DNA mismatch repair protein MutS
MHFTTDKQTMDDLNIFGKPGGDSIYRLFNRTCTSGGAAILEEMFRYPLSGEAAINQRSQTIRFFGTIQGGFPFDRESFDLIGHYLSNRDERTKMTRGDNTFGHKVTNLIAADKELTLYSKGVTALISLLQQLSAFMDAIRPGAAGTPYAHEVEAIGTLLADPDLIPVWTENVKRKLSFGQIVDYDGLFRFRKQEPLKKILQYVFRIDVYLSVAAVAAENQFCFPKALPSNGHSIHIEGLRHPLVKGAISNNLSITPDNNIIFLTGANMAGKSTLMKSLGISLLLAHMGFPVAAASMTFAVRDGIFTSINLADNLSMGASHFYAEVLRIKKVARELSLSRNLVIIFDELFRGTNVKDAYEATIAITGAFAGKRNCMFVVSTHIMEAGEVLKARHDNIRFQYLPTRMNGNKPVYTYKLETGITEDRQGMIIINNEGILDILEKKRK